MADARDLSVDVLVVGSGNGALTAALVRLRDGRPAMCWWSRRAPCTAAPAPPPGAASGSPAAATRREAGARTATRRRCEYVLGSTPAGRRAARRLQETYLRQGPLMLDFLHERTRVRYESLAHYPDYWSTCPGAKHGHRSLEPAPVARSVLGAGCGAAARHAPHDVDVRPHRHDAGRRAGADGAAAGLEGRWPARRIWDYVSDVGWALRQQALAAHRLRLRRHRAPALVDARPQHAAVARVSR